MTEPEVAVFTDGADYQYDVTYTIDDGPNVYGPMAHWVDETVVPDLQHAVDAIGLEQFHLVVHDAGGPVGFQLAKLGCRFTSGVCTSEVTVYVNPGLSPSGRINVPVPESNATRLPAIVVGTGTAGSNRPSSPSTVIRSVT